MNVGELRKKLQGLLADMPVVLELFDDDGVQIAVGDLEAAADEMRCDEIPRCYLSATHGEVQEPAGEPIGDLRLVP